MSLTLEWSMTGFNAIFSPDVFKVTIHLCINAIFEAIIDQLGLTFSVCV